MLDFPSRIDPNTGTVAGLLSAIGVYMIYNDALPTQGDVRTMPPADPDVESSRKAAAFKSIGLLSIVFLVTRNMDAFIIGGSSLIGIDLMYKHANGVHPATGKLADDAGALTIAPGLASSFPVDDYDSELVA